MEGPGSRSLFTAALLPVLGIACQSAPPPEPATLVVTGVRVWTGDAAVPWAQAVACRGDTIVAVDSAEAIEPYIGPATQVVRHPGGFLVPGFIDSHIHFLTGGSSLASVQLRDAATPEEFTHRIGEFAATLEPGEWILDGNWDHTLWGGELPQRDWIDSVTPDHPVFVMRLDGHMGLANSRALELAGLDEDSADIEGGAIVRYASGEPTGLLKDNAMSPVLAQVPPPSTAQLDRYLEAAMDYVASLGVTTVHDVFADGSDSWQSLATYRRAEARGALRTRIYSVPPLAEWERVEREVAAFGRGSDWLRIGAVKGFMDGSLGSHTAAFLEPFSDTPGESGFLTNSRQEMAEWIAGADAADLHLVVHAIGDRAIRQLLDIYSEVTADRDPRGRRFRMEHAQHIDPEDLPRFAELGVIASMQPYHAIDDGRWAETVIGPERAKTTYAFRSLLDRGALVAMGSDWPVAPASPIEGIYAAVTRRTLDGANPEGWVPEQRIRVEEALRGYTFAGAFASFEEDRKGTLTVGRLADMVLLDRDLTAVSPESLRQAQVLKTIVGGEVVFGR